MLIALVESSKLIALMEPIFDSNVSRLLEIFAAESVMATVVTFEFFATELKLATVAADKLRL